MNSNLITGILSKIEHLSAANLEVNNKILTSINKTNSILEKEIGTELRKQTKLLEAISRVLASGTNATNILIDAGDGKKATMLLDEKAGSMLKAAADNLKLFVDALKDVSLAKDNLETLEEAGKILRRFALGMLATNALMLTVTLGAPLWRNALNLMSNSLMNFATTIQMAGPMLAGALLTTLPLLYAWVKIFLWLESKRDEIEYGIDTMVKMALGVLTILASLAVMFYLLTDPKKLLYAVGMLVASVLTLAGMYFLLSKMRQPVEEGGSVMFEISASISLLVVSIAAAAFLLGSPEGLNRAFRVLVVSIVALVSVFFILSLFKKNVETGAKTMLMISGAIALMVGTIVLAANFMGSPEKTLFAFFTIAVGIGILIGIYMLIGKMEKTIKKSIKSAIYMAISTAIIVFSVTSIVEAVGHKDVIGAFVSVALGIMVLVGTFVFLNLFEKQIRKGIKTSFFLALATLAIVETLEYAISSLGKNKNTGKAYLAMVGGIIIIAMTFILLSLFDKKLKRGIENTLIMSIATFIIVRTIKDATEVLGDAKNVLTTVGAIAMGIGILVITYLFISLVGKRLKTSVTQMMKLAISTVLIVSTIAFAALVMGSPEKTMEATWLVAKSVLIMGITYAIISVFSKTMKVGVTTMIKLTIATALIMLTIFLASLYSGGRTETLKNALMVAGVVLILGAAYLVVGLLKSFIQKGAIAMLIASISVAIITYSIVQFKKSGVEMADVLLLTGFIVALGAAMALAGTPVVFPLIALGGVAMLIVAAALKVITSALAEFKETGWTNEDTILMKNAIVGVVGSFRDAFADISISDMLDIMAGVMLIGSIGNSLSSFAQGLSAFASMQAPVYEVQDGQLVLVDTKPLGPDIGKRVGETIEAFVKPLIAPDSAIAKLGEQTGFFTDGPIGAGIKLLGNIGNSLSNFAMGLSAMAELKVPIYEVDENGNLKLVSVEPLDPDFANKVGINIGKMVKALTGPLEQLGSKSGGLISDSDFEKGLSKLSMLGDPLLAIATSVEKLANKNLDTGKLKKTISAVFDTLTHALTSEEFEDMDEDKVEDFFGSVGDFTENLIELGDNSAGITAVFDSMNKSINELDISKVDKMNNLVYNLTQMAKEMSNSFADLETVLDKLGEVISDVNAKALVEEAKVKTQQSIQQVANGGAGNIGEIKEVLTDILNTLNSGIDVEVQNETGIFN
jgi:hypothetical protein